MWLWGFPLTWKRTEVSGLGALSGSGGGEAWAARRSCMCCRRRAGLSWAPSNATTCERSMEPRRIMDSG